MLKKAKSLVILDYFFLLLSLLIFAGLIFVHQKQNQTYAVQVSLAYQIREGPGQSYASLGNSNAGQVFQVLDTVKGEDTIYGNQWYLIEEDGQKRYIVRDTDGQWALTKMEFLKIEAINQGVSIDMSNANDQFRQEVLVHFPESYHEALLAIHQIYPAWEFEAFYAKDSWDAILDIQTNPEDRSLVQGGDSDFLAPYQWMVKNDTLYDGVNWYPATREGVAYYLDPRNFLNIPSIFQFLDLQNQERSSDVLEAVFAGNPRLLEIIPEIREASVEANVLPEALAVRIRQELSVGSDDISMIAKGLVHPEYEPLIQGQASPVYLSKEEQDAALKNAERALSEEEKAYLENVDETDEKAFYPEVDDVYYNFYNIGAYPDTSKISGALLNAARFARGDFSDEEDREDYNLPWDSVSKAITGGAKYMAKDYISIGQNTYYFQKFDFISGSYHHQYMQSIYAAYHEGSRLGNTLLPSLSKESKLRFIIPVIPEMPDTAVPWEG